MKAYRAWSESIHFDACTTVVFANNRNEAKKIAFHTETCEDSSWLDIRVSRYPEMDEHYRGLKEIDWYNAEDRRALVSLGWHCYDAESRECKACPAQDICDYSVEQEEI